MQLQNPFPQEVRLRYLYCYACFSCGRSDQGLELHHIVGRQSASALNACLLCKECHGHVGHTHPEENRFFMLNYRFLVQEHRYELREEDYLFLERFPWVFALAQS